MRFNLAGIGIGLAGLLNYSAPNQASCAVAPQIAVENSTSQPSHYLDTLLTAVIQSEVNITDSARNGDTLQWKKDNTLVSKTSSVPAAPVTYSISHSAAGISISATITRTPNIKYDPSATRESLASRYSSTRDTKQLEHLIVEKLTPEWYAASITVSPVDIQGTKATIQWGCQYTPSTASYVTTTSTRAEEETSSGLLETIVREKTSTATIQHIASIFFELEGKFPAN